MGRKRLCPECRDKMNGPDYVKTKVPFPSDPNCPECEKFRVIGARLTFYKVYACATCNKIFPYIMTTEEIKKHRYDFHWGSVEPSRQLITQTIEKAKVVKRQEQETKKVIEMIKEKTALQKFMDQVNECPDVHNAYLTEPPNFAPHLKARGIIIKELHIVPIGRPPYWKLEAFFGTIEKEGDAISEMVGDRVFLKIDDKIRLVRFIESPARLGHI